MKDYWAVLNYEIQMYFGARYLQGFPIKGADQILIGLQTSAMTEVKALHVRILLDMFLERKNSDDINIDDILPDWREKHKTIVHNLEVAYNKKLEIGRSPKWYLNKYLAHPDKRRGDHFDWAPVIKRMDTPLKEVFKTLPIDKLYALVYFRKYLYA
jgi:hypothetical protein